LEESCNETEHKRSRRSGLENDDCFSFSILETPGPIQPERRKNHVPEIEEAEKHNNVRQFNAHREERSEGTKARQMPNPDRSDQARKGEQAGVEKHEHLDEDLPAEVCHACTRPERKIMLPELGNGIWKSRRKLINSGIYVAPAFTACGKSGLSCHS
jgi:hypothetical protein